VIAHKEVGLVEYRFRSDFFEPSHVSGQAGSISICDSVSSELPGRFATPTDQ
jgi:hypothetical protein